jgi:hypothetical protein
MGRMTAPRIFLLGLLGLVLAACATPVPKSGDYQRSVPMDYLGFMVDTDLLNTSQLDAERKPTAQGLLKTYYNIEYSLSAYIEALENSLGGNEQLTKDYSTADSFVGAVAGLSSIGVIFATAAVAAPVTGVVWIVVSQYIQHYHIDPQIRKTERQLEEAQSLLRLLPDVEKLFNGLAYAENAPEAQRRFQKWAAYVINLDERSAKFFARTSDGRQPEGGSSAPVPPAAPTPGTQPQ